jgi:Zinc carboxypeptidase
MCTALRFLCGLRAERKTRTGATFPPAGIRVWLAVSLAAIACLLMGTSGAGAAIEPPRCGTPMPDAAENLPDGTDPADPPGSFPHIPYYAIGCTLEDIASRSGGRMEVEVIGQSALGRDMYKVTINALNTRAQQNDYARLQRVIGLAQRNPRRAQELIERRELKLPIFIQGSIHGNEYEGVDAVMRTIERLATTPYGEDPQVDAWLDHAVLVFNVIQNPDGRIVGTRTNGNGFDLNRDYITQSQPETVASVDVIREWFPTGAYDLHGYVEPTLVEGTTVPHNPGIEYDIWTKWNQPRMDANQAGLASEGFGITRPINNIPGGWIPAGETLPQGWDDWGPFYTGQYGQLRGLDAMTVEACNEIDAACGINGVPPQFLGRLGALRAHELVVNSSVDFLVENRREMLYDQYEIYRRGKEDAPRPQLTGPFPFPGTPEDHNYMTPYPRAHVIPVGAGQRSDAEAKRLVDFLLANDIEVSQLRRDHRFGGRTFQAGSYVVFLNQSLRALANTMLDVGDDISDRVTELYAPPGAWSNGFLWGADVVTIERDRRFTANTRPVEQADAVEGGVRTGRSDWLALELDSRTAVRTANELIGAGVPARLALEPFETRDGDLPAGSILFAESARAQIRVAGRAAGLWFEPVRGLLPRREPIERVPRIACLCSALENWAIETRLGFVSDQFTNASINTAPADPLANYDVIYNTNQSYPQDTPENATVRARYVAFFAGGWRLRRSARQRRRLRGARDGRRAARRPRGRMAGQAHGSRQGDGGRRVAARVLRPRHARVPGGRQRHRPVGQRGPPDQPDHRRLSRARHGARRGPRVVHRGPGRRGRGRAPAGVRLPRVRPLAEPRSVGGRLAGHHPRAQHRGHRSHHALRNRPAVSRASRAELPGGVGGLLLG